MRKVLAAAAASILALAASPALAQNIPDAEANTMLTAMSTPAFDVCTDSEKAKDIAPLEQLNACQTALSELATTRTRNRKATPGQKEVYGFFESAVEMGRTYAMLRVDGAPTARVCTNIEHQWVLSNQANTAVVGPELRSALESTKESVRPLVKMCREQFSTPADALPI